jgi:hypothetical protein
MTHQQHDKQNTSHRDEPENTQTKGKGPLAEKGDQHRDETNHHTGKTRHKGETHKDNGLHNDGSEQNR